MTASVLLITYNHARYIAQAIDSVLAQQVGCPFEIVIGDDCSTDGTRQIVQEFARRHPDRIRLLLPERNRGLNGNRLFVELLAECGGDYVAFLDGDDYWSAPDKLQRQITFLDEHPECAMCYHNVTVVHEDDPSIEPYTFTPPDQKAFSTIDDLLPGNFVQTCAAMVRRVALGNVPEWLVPIEPLDWALYLHAASHGTIGYIDETMAVYRRHSGAVWHGHKAAYYLETAVQLLEAMAPHLDPRCEPMLKEQLSRRSYELSRAREAEDDWAGAAASLTKSMVDHPAWMEGYLPGIGAKGSGIWRILERKVRLYRWPAGSRLLRHTEPWRRAAGWALTLAIKTIVRVVDPRGWTSRGRLSVASNPVRSSGSESAVVVLSWTSRGADALELHLGAPDGPGVTHSGPVGSLTTGQWVTDGMCFFLQDVSRNRPLTLAHTLDAVRVRVTHG